MHTDKKILVNAPEILKTHLYKRRWGMLLIFSFLSMCNATAWMTYSPVASDCADFYETTPIQINMLSLIFMILYIPFVMPAASLIDKKGLRIGIILGAILNCLGCWIRYFGKSPKTFFLVWIGQTMTSLAQTLILGIPPRLSTNWFGENERATATTIGAVFNQLGAAVAFLMATLIVKEKGDIPNLVLVQAIMSSLAALLTILFFRGNPPIPPSSAAILEKTDFKTSLFQLIRNRSFVLLFFAFGINVGGFYAISTVLEQTISPFGYSVKSIGIFGFVMVVVGIVGATIIGVLADKIKKLKILLLICYFGTLFTLIFFTFEVKAENSILLGVTCGLLGLFMTSALPISMEAVVSVTLPIAEELSTGIILMSAQIFGIGFTLSMSYILKALEVKYSNWFLVGFIGLSAVLVIPFQLHQKIEKHVKDLHHSLDFQRSIDVNHELE